MSRKIIPIAVAGVLVAVMILTGKHRNDGDRVRNDVMVSKDDDRRSSREERKKKKNASGQYALDVQRENWPPLEDSSALSAASVAPDALSTSNYYIVLDGSGSMLSERCGGGSRKIDAAVLAVKHFFESVPANANIGLAAFDRREVSERVSLGTNNRDALVQALNNVQAGSDTPLLSSMKIAYAKLTEQARKQLGYGEYHLIVVTDGKPDPESEDPKPIVKEILAQSPVVLHTIGFCIDDDHVLNQKKRTYYASATDPAELDKSLQAVLAEAPVFDATKFN